MTMYDDPNRECVGLEPIWTTAEEVPPEVDPGSSPSAYDPGEHTVDDVLAYVDEHPDQADAVLTAEELGKNRSTLVSALGG